MNGRKHIRFTSGALIVAAVLPSLLVPSPVRCNELRIMSLGNCRIALTDEDNRLNPYDYGRNSAYLLSDYEESWARLPFGIAEESGELKRLYDPLLVNTLAFGAEGIKKLGDRHVVWGIILYERLLQRETYRALEYDQYNDPFYLTDLSTGDFRHWGPTMQVDYAFRLSSRWYLGLGLDYALSTGLKDRYTAPEITRNYAKGNFGLIYRGAQRWTIGVTVRPMRIQNRTNFEKTDEGYDNIIHRYSGDGIYDVRSFSSQTIREILMGIEAGVQTFVMTERFTMGVLFDYAWEENEIEYGTSRRDKEGYWQRTSYDLRARTRYRPAETGFILGLEGRLMRDEGWAKRPKFEEVLLYDNPVDLASIGAGLSYHLVTPLNLLVSADYVMNKYDVTATDHGAGVTREADIVQNIGRFGLEYDIMGVYSFRGGLEITDYLIDRWLKLPENTDRYRFTAGFGHHTGTWKIDVHFAYSHSVQSETDATRRGFSGIVWLTRPIW